MPIERRRAPRKTLSDLAFINLEPDNGGIVVDVSEDGLGFHSAVPVEVSGPVKFWFSMRSIDRLDASGVIAWTDESRKSGGIRFVELNDDVRARLRGWLGDANPTAASTLANESHRGLGRSIPGVTLGSSAEAVRQPSARDLPPTSAMFGSLRRDPPVEPSKKSQADASSQSPADANSALNSSNPRAGNTGLPIESQAEQARPSLLTSPLSLLATEPSSSRNALSQALDSDRGHDRSSENSPAESGARSGLPMIVVVLAAIAVTVIGYYTLRLRSPRTVASQQHELPLPQESVPSISSAPADSTNAASSSPSAAQPPSSSSSEQLSPTIPPSKSGDAKPSTNSAASSAPAPAIDDAGKAELDEARLFLLGADGKRDPARAAQLLWSAVGNGSVIAEVELARLYIAGDGVRKNCEQARVLLRAAISRGSNDATDQLAELARTGCAK